jgi:hypothetical protein
LTANEGFNAKAHGHHNARSVTMALACMGIVSHNLSVVGQTWGTSWKLYRQKPEGVPAGAGLPLPISAYLSNERQKSDVATLRPCERNAGLSEAGSVIVAQF